MPLRSITVRLTFLFAAVSTAVLLVLGLLVGILVEQHFEELDTDLLWGQFERVEDALLTAHSQSDLQTLRQTHPEALAGNHGMSVLITGADGSRLLESGAAEFPDALLGAAKQRAERPLRWTDQEGQTYRGIAAEARTGIAGAPPVVIAVSTNLAHHEHFMSSFRSALWMVVGSAALLSAIFGWLAVRRGLLPLRVIGQRAAAVTASRLDQRLSVESFPVELAAVAQSLNEMLARLQESFRRLSDFSDDIAHELRTPVSNLLTQTQVTLSKPRSDDEYREVLASNVEELERLARTISDMLFLAKAENNLLVPNREDVDLCTEARQVLDFYEAMAEEKGVHLTCDGEGRISGDRLMLRRAINNLVSNAVRHTPSGGRVRIHISRSSHEMINLAVENTGQPLAPEHLSRVFDRFYRADASRQNFGEGAGLGLAITRSIARAHGGEACAQTSDGLTRFELRLPVASMTSSSGSPVEKTSTA